MNRPVMIPLAQIDRPADLVRPRMSRQGIEGLAASIREHGLLNPVTVVRREYSFQLVAGVRRTLAAELAGLECIPAMVVEADRERAYELGLIENIQREAMGYVDEARALQALQRTTGLSVDGLGRRLGKTPTWVSMRLAVLELGAEAQAALSAGDLRLIDVKGLLRQSPEAQAKAVRRPQPHEGVVREGTTVRTFGWRQRLNGLLANHGLTDEEGERLLEATRTAMDAIKAERP